MNLSGLQLFRGPAASDGTGARRLQIPEAIDPHSHANHRIDASPVVLVFRALVFPESNQGLNNAYRQAEVKWTFFTLEPRNSFKIPYLS